MEPSETTLREDCGYRELGKTRRVDAGPQEVLHVSANKDMQMPE